MNNRTVQTLVGALIVAIGVVVFLLSQQSDPDRIDGGYEVTASFGAIDGVSKGTRILLTGLPVGDVDAFYYDETQQRAVVTMSIQHGIEIPLDSVVMIVTDGLLGAKYLKIQAGGDTEMMKPGDQFEYTQDSIVLEEILEKVILNAEQKRKEEKEKKDGETPAKKPNKAFLSGQGHQFAETVLPKAQIQR